MPCFISFLAVSGLTAPEFIRYVIASAVPEHTYGFLNFRTFWIRCPFRFV